MTRPKRCRLRRRLHLRWPCLTLFLLTLALLSDSTGTVRVGLCCAALHECGHIAAYAYLWHRLPLLELSPFGICLRLRGQPMTRREQLVLSAAGPLQKVDGIQQPEAAYRSILNEPICFTRSSKSSRSCFALFLTFAL